MLTRFSFMAGWIKRAAIIKAVRTRTHFEIPVAIVLELDQAYNRILMRTPIFEARGNEPHNSGSYMLRCQGTEPSNHWSEAEIESLTMCAVKSDPRKRPPTVVNV